MLVRLSQYFVSMRRWGRCGRSRLLRDFAWRQHYRRHRQRYTDQARRREEEVSAERLKFLIDYLREHPCVDCGERDPVVLEFDDLRDKCFGVGQGFRDRNWQSVLDEIAKCEVVCANCHRRRTARRGGFARAAVAQW